MVALGQVVDYVMGCVIGFIFGPVIDAGPTADDSWMCSRSPNDGTRTSVFAPS